MYLGGGGIYLNGSSEPKVTKSLNVVHRSISFLVRTKLDQLLRQFLDVTNLKAALIQDILSRMTSGQS